VKSSEERGLWVLVNVGAPAFTGRDEVLKEHSITDQASQIGRKLIEEAGDTWGAVTTQLSNMLLHTSSAINDYQIESITIQLGIDGHGNIGVVQAGLSASFEITFKKIVK
jgi:hypothetical protein